MSATRALYRQVRACVLEHGFALEGVLPSGAHYSLPERKPLVLEGSRRRG